MEKPDFEKLAREFASILLIAPIKKSMTFTHGYKSACEKIWSEYVEPLQRENERLKNDLLDALDLKAGHGPTALSMLQSKINELESTLNTPRIQQLLKEDPLI